MTIRIALPKHCVRDMADVLLGLDELTQARSGRSDVCAGAGKRQRVSPQDGAFHFFNRAEADKEAQRKPHLEEAAMALLLLDVHSAPRKVICPFLQATSLLSPGCAP